MAQNGQSVQHAPFVTPSVDDNDYRLITLNNGLVALLISDKEAEKAAAAMDVRVGSLSDPDDIPGLAHFLEHMLFYSSEKFPTEDEYSKFMSEHGGHTNAYTSNESTNYHFDVNTPHLPQALERFAQFFICPLISPDGVDREANAVDSEHGKNLNADAWKKLQLWKHTANRQHPFAHFSTGNLETLITEPKGRGVSVHDRVKAFYQEHYSAGVMKLAVLSSHSLEELEELVRKNFEAVEDRNIHPPSFTPEAVTSEQCGLLIKMVPERDGHSVELQWPTVSEQEHYKAGPSHYISHLLGHEGEGSAFALLKKKGWATGLVAGEASTSYSARSFFMTRIDLTDAGHANITEVINIIFKYLDVLRQPDGINVTIWNEMQALAQLKFNYRDKLNPYNYVSSLAHGMQVYESEDLLQAMYNVPLQYDPELIGKVLEDLRPEKARVMWISKALQEECTDTEPWYGTKYHLSSLPPDWLSLWSTSSSSLYSKDLYLPAPNPFIPSNFSLVETSAPAPTIIHTTPMTTVWYRPNPDFKVPKAVMYIHLHLPESYLTPESAVLTQLYSKLVNDALSEITYPAELAGVHYGVRPSTQGIMFTVSGYHDALPRLGQVVVDAMLSFEPRADRFAVVKEKLAKDFQNMRYDQPYQVAMYNLAILMEAQRWHVRDYETVLPGLTLEGVQTFFPRLLRKCKVEAYVTGTLPVDTAVAFLRSLEQQLQDRCGSQPPFSSQFPQQRVVQAPQGKAVVWPCLGPNPGNDNSAAVVAFQIGPDNQERNALTDLITHIGKRDAFYQLRTIGQLGYITHCTSYWTLTTTNIAFILQSTAKGAAYLAQRVEAFLPLLEQRLQEMSGDEFRSHVEELCTAKLEKPKRLREAAGRDWREIEDGSLRFGRRELEVAALAAVTQDQVVEFYREHVLRATSRKKIVTLVQALKGSGAEALNAVTTPGGQDQQQQQGGAGDVVAEVVEALKKAALTEEPEAEVVEDAYAWKRMQALYPSLK